MTQGRETSERPSVLLTLAHLLERLDRSPTPVDAGQYRLIASRLQEAMRATPADAALQAILTSFTSAAEVYENLYYPHAGLCRSPLQAALEAEIRTAELLRRIGRQSRGAERAAP